MWKEIINYSHRSAQIFVLLLLFCVQIQAQVEEILELELPESGGSIEHTARQKVNLKTGYHFESTDVKVNRRYYTDENQIVGVNYEPLFDATTFDNREINTDLAVGYTPGSHGVSPTGGATYNIPFPLPPGTNGMVPNVSVVYNSQGGNGLLGMGWNLSGSSAITRIPKAIYSDEEVGAIDFTDEDRFALDGNRLVSSNYGAVGAIYGTEMETFSRITSNGGEAGNPTSFTVETKDGMTMEYGQAYNSSFKTEANDKTIFWLLNKTMDCFGNYVEYKYIQKDRETLLDEILYTGNASAGLAPYNRIKFYYSEREDENTAYINGSAINSNHLLSFVKIYVEEKEVFKSYEFRYGFDGIHSFLNEVVEYGCGTEELNSTIFQYGDGATEGINSSNLNTYVPNLSLQLQSDLVSGDFNGDGRSDFIEANWIKNDDGIKYHTDINVYTTTDSGLDPITLSTSLDLPYNFSIASVSDVEFESPNSIVPIPVDFTGDTKADLLLIERNTNGPASNMNPHTLESIRLYDNIASNVNPDNYDELPIPTNFNIIRPGGSFIATGDFNGDSKGDMVTILSNTGGYKMFWSDPSNDIFNEEVTMSGSLALSLASSEDMFGMDYNGDGKSEITSIRYGSTYIYELIYVDGSYTLNALSTSNYPTIYHDYLMGDFNGDGKSDFLTKNENGVFEIGYSKGKNGFDDILFNFQSNDPAHLVQGPNAVYVQNVYVGDYNGDGMSDIIHYNDPLIGTNTDSVIDVYYSTGTEFFHKQEVIPFIQGVSWTSRVMLGDYNGDSETDLFIKDYVHNYAKVVELNPNKENLLSKVKDGFNNQIGFTHESLADRNSTDIYKQVVPYSFPLNNIQAPIYCVTEVETPNGIGGSNLMLYNYENLILHRLGKGLIGFKTTVSFDETLHVQNTTNQVLDDTEYVLLPFDNTTQIYSPIVQLLSKTSYNAVIVNSDFSLHGSYYIEIDNTTVRDYLTGSIVQDVSTHDKYGNVINKTTNIANGLGVILETVDVSNTDEYQICSWIPNMYHEVVTTRTRLNESSQQKSVYNDFSTDHAITKEFLGEDKEVTTWTNFDEMGNVEDMTISASGDPTTEPRSTIIEYDSKGRYVISKTNTLGQTNFSTIDPKWGQPLNSTSITGLKNYFKYDAFGRTISVIDPRGNKVTTKWIWDIQNGNGTNILNTDNTVYHTVTEAPNNPIVSTWFDALNRERQKNITNFNGQITIQNKTYDNRGNVRKTTSPFFMGESPVITTNVYDDNNRLDYQTISGIGATNYLYDFDVNNSLSTVTVIPPIGSLQQTSQTTDATGKVVMSIDQGATLLYDYNSFGKQRAVTMLPGVSDYEFGNPLPSDAEIMVSMRYDQYGRQQELNDRNAGVTSYDYNAYGELVWQEDAKGNIYTNEYDVLGRQFKRMGPEGETTYDYWETGGGLNQIKLITGFNEPNPVIEYYKYDKFGQLTEIKEYINNNTYSTNYQYDRFGNNTHITYPSGFVAQNHFNEWGYMDKVTDKEGALIFEGLEKNSLGQYTRYKQGNGLTTFDTFNDYGMPMTSTTQSLAGVDVHNIETIFDVKTGNLEERTINHFREVFQYDTLNRLKSASPYHKFTDNLIKDSQITLVYDDNGNIVSKTDAGELYKYDLDKYNAVTNITNSTNNIPSFTQDIIYTPYHQPESITEGVWELQFVYGPDHQRRWTSLLKDDVLQETKIFLGNYEELITDSKTYQIHYIAGAIIVSEDNGQTFDSYYTYKDYLGSILTVTDVHGTITHKQNFDSWGRKRNAENYSYEDIEAAPEWLYRGYTGHEHLPEFGLINMNGRLYDPVLGRMLSVDNYVHDQYGSQGYNRYSYGLNNPLKFTDPNGEFPILVAAIVAGSINWMVNGGGFNARGLGNFTVGALAGGLSAGVGIGVYSPGFFSGAFSGLSAGFTNGFIGGLGNGLVNGLGFKASLSNGLKQGVKQGLIGGVTGGIIGGFNALSDGNNFFTGKQSAEVFKSPVSDNLGNQNGECVLRCFEEFSESYNLPQFDYNYWLNENGNNLGVHARNVEGLVDGTGNFLADPLLPVNGQNQAEAISNAITNNRRVIVGFKTSSGGEHAVMVRKVKIWPTGRYKIWFAETSPVRIAPYSTSDAFSLTGARFWSFWR